MFEDRPSLEEIAKPEARLQELEYRLRRIDPDAAVTLLVAQLTDPYPPIRHRVADELAAAAAGGELTEKISDGLRQLCRSCLRRATDNIAEAAGALGLDSSLEPSGEIRQAACRILAGFDDIDSLKVALADEHPDVRYQALVGLHDVDPDSLSGERLSEFLEDDDEEISVVAAQWLAEIGAQSTAMQIIELYRTSRAQSRMAFALAAAELIGEHGASVETAVRRQLVEELIDALDDERTASAATSGLVRLDAEQAIQPLIDLLNGWFIHPIIRVQAAAALVEFDHERGREYLEDALQDSRRDVRGAALRAVGRMRLERFRDELESLALSNKYHADTAVLALAEWGDEQARDILEQVAAGEHESGASDLARRALSQIKASGRAEPDRLQFLEV